MLLFVDESGHDQREMPCEVLAGVLIAEQNLWNLIRAIRSAEKDHFGGYLREFLLEERKAKKLLKKKRFRIAERGGSFNPGEQTELAHSLLEKGKRARLQGLDRSGETGKELIAYSKAVLEFVHNVLDIAASFNVRVIASVVASRAPRPEPGRLRKDYVYLFERYFYFLEGMAPSERGLVVFDELDKTKSHLLVNQMTSYFLGTGTGRYRSSRIVPEPFFVHSELTTGIFLADLAAYFLGWAWRLPSKMRQPVRAELKPYADKLHGLQYHGQKPNSIGDGSLNVFGIAYIDDLRGRFDKALELDVDEEAE